MISEALRGNDGQLLLAVGRLGAPFPVQNGRSRAATTQLPRLAAAKLSWLARTLLSRPNLHPVSANERGSLHGQHSHTKDLLLPFCPCSGII